jgi:NAD(P)-dependent dehydrogenase (short-subunit alcohol dehydrogenase family)
VKTVLITGATGGIGSAAVRELDRRGWRVFGAARNEGELKKLSADCRAVDPVTLDLTDEASIVRLRDQLAEGVGTAGLNAVVNAAGQVVQGPLELIPLHALRRQFEVNVIGPVAITQAVLPLLRAGRGRIVNISGAASQTALPLLGPISASKAALERCTDALRMELKPQGVPVSIVVPGLLDTRLHEKAAEASRRDGFAGSDETQAIYADVLETPERIVDGSKLAPVESVVSNVITALEAKRPAERYVVGRDARQLALLRLLPDRLRDRLLLWHFGLKPDRFKLPLDRPHTDGRRQG